METELKITTERVDDLVWLLQMMMRLGLPEILDRHIPRHWLQEGLSWGWVATVWLSWCEVIGSRPAGIRRRIR
jgi:transposase